MTQTIKMTREGYEALNAELEHLITVKRKENAARLKEAISYGDISENAEYDAAKDEQAETEERINEIEQTLRKCEIVDESESDDDGTVQIGKTVTIRDLIYEEEMVYKLVGETEADPFNGKLSDVSLVGQHIMGCKVGDVVEFAVPAGEAKYEILDVTK